MASVTQATLLTRLRTMLRDTGDIVYSSAEKAEALAQAITDDPFAFVVARDDSTVTVYQQNSYDLPSGFQQLHQLLIDTKADGFPLVISPDGFQVINGTVWINKNHKGIPGGVKLVQIGKKKLTVTDAIPDYLVGYILHTAAAYCMELLISDKTGRFLKNDSSLAEIQAAINNHRSVAMRYQKTLPNHNTVVF